MKSRVLARLKHMVVNGTGHHRPSMITHLHGALYYLELIMYSTPGRSCPSRRRLIAPGEPTAAWRLRNPYRGMEPPIFTPHMKDALSRGEVGKDGEDNQGEGNPSDQQPK